MQAGELIRWARGVRAWMGRVWPCRSAAADVVSVPERASQGLAAAVASDAGPAPGVAESGAPEPERFFGCGWFDSTHELHQGLTVVEHAGIDVELAVCMLLTPRRAARPA